MKKWNWLSGQPEPQAIPPTSVTTSTVSVGSGGGAGNPTYYADPQEQVLRTISIQLDRVLKELKAINDKLSGGPRW